MRVKKYIFLITIVSLAVLFVTAITLHAKEIHREGETRWVQLTDCIDKNLGYVIKCSPDWQLDVRPKSIHLLVDGKPGRIVTINISKSEESGLTLEDLRPSVLQYVYEYADHFKLARTKIGEESAIRVEANLAEYPDVKLLDYFLIQDTHLYRISFTVNTQEHYQKYEPFFVELADTFEFFDTKQGILTRKSKSDSSYK